MGSALYRRKAPHRFAIASSQEAVAAESRVVALAYFLWPVALYARVEPRPDASQWYRFHLRQALWFGIFSGVIALAAFAWPLILSLIIGGLVATLWIYAIAMLADIALFVLWLVWAMRYSQRAGRGELFEIAWVARLTGTRISK